MPLWHVPSGCWEAGGGGVPTTLAQLLSAPSEQLELGFPLDTVHFLCRDMLDST